MILIQTRKRSECYCINIRHGSNSITDYYDKKMKPTGLTINQYSLLINLDAIAPCTTTQLAQKMYLDRTTLTRNMKPLEKEGFIKNTAQPSQRNKKLILTEKGKSILKKTKPIWNNNQSDNEMYIGKENLETLLTLLEKLEYINHTERK